jgi:type II secretory pathway pseudopilin PulG
MELIVVVAILAVILGIFIGWMTVGIQLGIQKHKHLNTTSVLIEEIDLLKKDRDKIIQYAEYIAENLDNSITFVEYIATHNQRNP